jgi:uncharacterized membrane protein YcaP (DUF421 family)
MIWLRAIVVYLLTMLLFRALGRGLQFQARPYDVAVQVLLGSAAANLILDSTLPLWKSLVALGVLAILHTGISFLSLWNPVKTFLVGRPEVIIENGQILKANLIKHQISVDEVVASLREKGFANMADVEFAMLEASGKMSVVPRSQARPVTPKDLHVDTAYEGLSTALIVDGMVERHNLKKVGLTEEWLMGEIVSRGAAGFEEVLFASLDTQGQLFVVRDRDVPFLQAVFKGIHAQTPPGQPPGLAGRH